MIVHYSGSSHGSHDSPCDGEYRTGGSYLIRPIPNKQALLDNGPLYARSHNTYKFMRRQREGPKWRTIRDECLQQFATFQRWDALNKYQNFHSSHYDWWTFPIDQPSSYRDKYQVGPQQLAHLASDPLFIQALRGNAILVCRSWGWDILKGKPLTERTEHQKWQRWPIRLYKMANSLELFKQEDLLRNAVVYALSIMDRGEHFFWSGKDLEGYFRSRRGLTASHQKWKEQKEEKEKKEEKQVKEKQVKEKQVKEKQVEEKKVEEEKEEKLQMRRVHEDTGPERQPTTTGDKASRFKSMGKPMVNPPKSSVHKPTTSYQPLKASKGYHMQRPKH